MANDFSGDSAGVALYNFESGALTTDSIGSNTLTDNNTVGVDTTNYMQGSASADFEADNSESLSRADADLSSDFPFKSGGSETNISIAGWFVLESHNADMVLFSKYSVTGDERGFCFRTESTSPHLNLIIGYNSGVSFETIALTSDNSLQVGRWYHVGLTYNRSTRAWTCRLWDDTAQQIVENNSGTGTQTMYINAIPIYIGCYGHLSGYFDGRKDELVIFNDIKTSTDFDDIRQGNYGSGGTTLTVADLAHSHALDVPAAIQAHQAAVADLAHNHILDSITIAQAIDLIVASLAHTHSLDPPAAIQAHAAVIAEIAHAHSLDTVQITTALLLQVANLIHTHNMDAPALTQAHALSIGELSHDHNLESPLLIQAYNLVAASLDHTHNLDSITLSTAINLVVHSLLHVHSLDSTALTQVHILAVDSLGHTHDLGAVDLTQAHNVSIADLTHSHTIDSIVFVTAVGRVTINFSDPAAPTVIFGSVKAPSITFN